MHLSLCSLTTAWRQGLVKNTAAWNKNSPRMQTTKVEGKNLFFSKANLWVSILTLIALIAAIAKFTTVQKVDQGEKQSLEELTRQVAKIADTLTVKDQVAPNVLQVEKQGPVWGSVFGGTPQRKNIRMDCNIDGTPICCSMVNITQIKSHHKSHNSKVVNENDDHCVTSRLYVSSPYELEQLALGVKLSSITDGNERMAALVKQIYDPDEVAKSRVWLRRVEARMSGTDEVVTNEDDLKYLSRFETTRKCKSKVSTWSEFIEPITIHARHPFGMNEIINPQTMVDGISLISTDYVLLDSAQNIERRAPKGRKGNANLKKYFFDAGTSRFDSSLALFACTYAQVVRPRCGLMTVILSIAAILIHYHFNICNRWVYFSNKSLVGR